MKKIVLIAIAALAMGTNLSADVCLYNGSAAAVSSITFKWGWPNEGKITSTQKDFLALGDKICVPREPYTFIHSIFWKHDGQDYGSENNAKDMQSFDFYIDKDNTLKVGKGY